MKMDADYRKFRLNTSFSPEFRHIWLLVWWPLYGLGFRLLERSWPARDVAYHTVYAPLDAMIPFCEWFVFPYLLWFAAIVGMLAYTFFFDVRSFKRFMWFVMITYTLTLLIYLVWPTKQELRPDVFLRDNWMTRFMADFYAYDTNTNVCPSLHVIGAWTVCCCAWHTKGMRHIAWRIGHTVLAVLITLSTVFLKQHSVHDVWPALLICAVTYIGLFTVPQWAQKRCATQSCGAEK